MPGAPLGFRELEFLWIEQGGGPLYAPVAAAIALAESNGCPDAVHGPTDIRPLGTLCQYVYSAKEDSRGLWQINVMAHEWAEDWNLLNPRVNARAAVSIAKRGRDFSPWTTYKNGAYRRFIPRPIPPPVRPYDEQLEGKPFKPRAGIAPKAGAEQFHHDWDYLTRVLGRALPRNVRKVNFYRRRLKRAVK